MARILLIEDEEIIRRSLRRLLERQQHEVSDSASVEDAESRWNLDGFDLIIADLRLPGRPGTDVLQLAPEVPSIIMTSYASVRSAVEAMKQGAVDYVAKPFDNDELLLTVERALKENRLERQNAALQADIERSYPVAGIVGNCIPMQEVFERIGKVAPTDTTVLILGESGTGKELVARALHANSRRADAPLIAVNCAAIPESLIEAELFGHEKGAFTGAVGVRQGLVEAANGGTLFLDEIGEMPMALQAKLLRVLEDGSLRPVGADEETRVDVRIVAATHRDLERAVTDGDFREDLYYRLDTFTIPVPPLRDRAEDIGTLAAGFLAAGAKRQGQEPPDIATDAMEALQLHDWPGNVRELANAMERALAFCDGTAIRQRDLPGRVGETRLGAEPQDPAGERTLAPLADVEAAHIRRVLQAVGGNRRRAAEILGIGRRTLYRKLQEDGQ